MPHKTYLISDYLALVKQCLASKSVPLTQLLHCHLIKTSLTCHTFLSNHLTRLYSLLLPSPSSALRSFHETPFKNLHSFNTLLSSLSSHDLPAALHLFDGMPQRNIVSYNTVISSLSRCGRYRQALDVFKTMDACLRFDRFTVVAVAAACTGLGELRLLKQVHASVVLGGLEMNLIMGNVFVDGYAKCGDIESSCKMFYDMPVKDVFSWTSLIGGYARIGKIEEARKVFDSMPVRNAVSWSALISGYEQNNDEDKAIELFEEMIDEGLTPTPFTLVSVLSACARLGLILRGKQVHCYIARRSGFLNIFTYNAFIDMYSKCGDMSSATKVFNSMPERDTISWNSMITGLAQNGLAMQSLQAFENMVQSGIAPTHVTFLGMLSACSHAGLVPEARGLLKLMQGKYNVCPNSEHYAAFIDALGRKGQLAEAMELIESLPLTNISIWGALLGACQVHGDLEIGERAAETLFQLEPENGARYATLLNIYAAAGKWDKAKRVRICMKRKGLRKDAGFSWIEVRSVKNVFGAGDESHCKSEEIYGMLHVLVDEMMEVKTKFFSFS